jgi:hypothetical protein
MMISRRPNSLLSTETLPGPSRAIAVATITTRTAGRGVSKRSGVDCGSHRRTLPTVPRATRALATGVRNPIKTETPLAAIAKPTSQIPNVALTRSEKYIVPWITAVRPIAALSSNNPTPGTPLGNAENSRDSAVSSVLAYGREHF